MINRPIDVVFAFFTEPANDPRWRSHVETIAAEGPPAVGRRIAQTVAGPGGRRIQADIEVTDYDPPLRYGFQVVAGPVRPHGDFRFSATDSGTEVTFSLNADLSGIKKLVMSKPVQASMDSETAGLTVAKTLLETAES